MSHSTSLIFSFLGVSVLAFIAIQQNPAKLNDLLSVMILWLMEP
jgi:hypothetical protein